MSAYSALLVFCAGVAGLFYLDRDHAAKPSRALWLPVTWFLIIGSRPVSVWLGLSSGQPNAQDYLEGSPLDAAVFGILLVLALFVAWRRRSAVKVILRRAWPVPLYFAFCLLSVAWSDFTDISFKRWIKALGDLVMVLVIVSDGEPLAALQRFFSRTGFLLLPFSVLLIKYYGNLGRSYDRWTGMAFNTGVTTNKNTLGAVTWLLALGALWQLLLLVRDRQRDGRKRRIVAQATLVLFGLALLGMAHSATSGAVFAIGCIVAAPASLFAFKKSAAAHALVIVLLLCGGAALYFSGEAGVTQALGRHENLTGRTAIWAYVIPMNPNPLLGAGFESFWLGSRLQQVWAHFPSLHVNEAHDGYIEAYLELGWMGVALIALILLVAYRRITAAWSYRPRAAGLMLGYLVALALYNISEAGFRLLSPTWFFLLLVICTASHIPRAAAPDSAGAQLADAKAQTLAAPVLPGGAA